ncbi:MAG TPA: hypothetical protein DCS19_01580 [Flavobacterium sp.]|nr:hypothetical protein [Flavobacterium sp.]
MDFKSVFRQELDKEIALWLRDYQLRSSIEASTGFDESELTEDKRQKRLQLAQKDFWAFDRIYFPSKIYRQGFSKPATFHHRIVEIMNLSGIHFIAGPRAFAKSVTGRKFQLWELLTRKKRFTGAISEDLPPAQAYIAFMLTFLSQGRIMQDFRPDIQIASKDVLQFSCTLFPSGTAVYKAFSIDRSVRGQLEGLDRPESLVADDIETLDSSFTNEAVSKRLAKLQEAYESLDVSSANLTVFANNFDRRCLTNRLIEEQEKFSDEELQETRLKVHVFRAWEKGRSLWRSRFPANSEADLRRMLGVTSESSWQGNYQQNPMPADGEIFKREYYQEWSELPKDCRGVIYTDQNLAKKGKGDTTAITACLFSPKTGKFYINSAVCRSFSSSLELFNNILSMMTREIVQVCFDGNVSQESYWRDLLDAHGDNNEDIRLLDNYSVFKRYKTDELSANCQLLYEQSKILFPPGFANSKDGKQYLSQLFSFRGKKAGKTDDAPDSLICSIQAIFDRGFGRRSGTNDYKVFTFKDKI